MLPNIIITLLFVVAVHGQDVFDAYRSSSGRIVNGSDALEGQFPYQISLKKDGIHSCGGSVINEYYILTAAHCLMDAGDKVITIEAGTTYLGEGLQFDVEELIPHPEYDPDDQFINDIALVKLTEPFPLGDFIQPIVLPEAEQKFEEGSPAILTGWGFPHSGGTLMDKLQNVILFTLSYDECLAIHENEDLEYPLLPQKTTMCAVYPGGGRGQCTGDSGGPLVVGGVQVGVVSWSLKPCAEEFPGVFTEVAQFVDWIDEQIKQREFQEMMSKKVESIQSQLKDIFGGLSLPGLF